MTRPTGLTRDVGWEIGVSRTVPYAKADVWNVLVSARGLGVWLGPGVSGELVRGGAITADGGRGEVRGLRVLERVRVLWHPSGGGPSTVIQTTLTGSRGKTVVRFHQERLRSAEERERRRHHWIAVMEAFQKLLENP